MFPRDPGLQFRMLLTLFLLGLLYVAFIVALLAAGAGLISRRRDGRAVARAAVPLGQARAFGDGRQGGLAAGGARASTR